MEDAEKNFLFRNLAVAILVAAALFFLEKVFSAWLLAGLGAGEGTEIFGGAIFFQAIANRAWVFSIPLTPILIYFFSALGLAAAFWIFIKYFFARGALAAFGLALILSGACSNLWSRISEGFVWDYFGINFFGLSGSWNLADIFILAGMAIWLMLVLKEKNS